MIVLGKAGAIEMIRLAILFLGAACALCYAQPATAAQQMSSSGSAFLNGGKIIFQPKDFYGSAAVIWARGTLIADWLAYKNNTYSIRCTPDRCEVAYVEQIGPNQISEIQGPIYFAIKQWTDDDEIVAQADDLCRRTTITISRTMRKVLWVETPINQTEIACKNSNTSIRKAIMGSPPFWHGSGSRR